ncbi:hypothetical protein ACN6LL_006995 [Streptomyces violaceoruber]
MMLEGSAPEPAWAAVRRARCARVPDTEEQHAWTPEFFRRISPRGQDGSPTARR